MLTLTDTAGTVVKTIVGQGAVPEASGLRIQGNGLESTEFEISVVASPAEEDSVVEHDGARVFLEPAAAVALSDKTLDAQVGEDGSVRFALVPQVV